MNLLNSGLWGRLSMESQPQNCEFRNNPENFLPWNSRTVWLDHLHASQVNIPFSQTTCSSWTVNSVGHIDNCAVYTSRIILTGPRSILILIWLCTVAFIDGEWYTTGTYTGSRWQSGPAIWKIEMAHTMWFRTMWHFDMNTRLRRAYASSFKPRNSKWCWVSSIEFSNDLAKALIRLGICTGWYESLLVAHTTFLEISCHGSNIGLFVQHLLSHLNPLSRNPGLCVGYWKGMLLPPALFLILINRFRCDLPLDPPTQQGHYLKTMSY